MTPVWLMIEVAVAYLKRGRATSKPCDLDFTLSCDNNYFHPHCDQEEYCSSLQLWSEETGMALQVFLAHTGERLQADPASFPS